MTHIKEIEPKFKIDRSPVVYRGEISVEVLPPFAVFRYPSSDGKVCADWIPLSDISEIQRKVVGGMITWHEATWPRTGYVTKDCGGAEIDTGYGMVTLRSHRDETSECGFASVESAQWAFRAKAHMGGWGQ